MPEPSLEDIQTALEVLKYYEKKGTEKDENDDIDQYLEGFNGVLERVREKIQRECWEYDEKDLMDIVHTTTQNVLSEKGHTVDNWPNELCDTVTQTAYNRILSEIPDTFDYGVGWSEDYGHSINVQTGCPNCGNTTVFNGTIEQDSQWVGYEKDEKHDTMMCGADDTMGVEVTYLACGKCWEVLVDKKE